MNGVDNDDLLPPPPTAMLKRSATETGTSSTPSISARRSLRRPPITKALLEVLPLSQTSSADEDDNTDNDVVGNAGVSEQTDSNGSTSRNRLRQLRRNPNQPSSSPASGQSPVASEATASRVSNLPPLPSASLIENTVPVITFAVLIVLWRRQEDGIAAIFPAEFVETLEDMLLMFVFPFVALALKFWFYYRRYQQHKAYCESVKTQCRISATNTTKWDEKVRVYIGHISLSGATKGSSTEEGGEALSLAQHDATDRFRDALLLYANDRWVHKDKCLPSQSVSMGLLDFGDVEVQSGDGKTQRQKRRQLLFLPLDESTSADLGSGAQPLGKPGMLAPLSCTMGDSSTTRPDEKKSAWSIVKSALQTVSSSMGSKYKVDGVWERFAPLTDSGDIQLCIMHSSGGASSSFVDGLGDDDSEGSGKRKSKSGGGGNNNSGSIFLDIYGQNVPARLNALMEEVMEFSASVSSGGGVGEKEKEGDKTTSSSPQPKPPLFWLDLTSFNKMYRVRERSEPKPDFLKKPIHGDLEYQMSYHHSFFHPQKDNIFGIKGFSVVDKFQDKEGAFSIPGVQRKLNFLLYGPPGTGKSKLIRTLAMYLQRTVVSAKLSQFQTAKELTNFMDNLKFIDAGKDDPDQNCFEDFIFVIEEIDTDERGICLDRGLVGENKDGGAHETSPDEAGEEESDQENGFFSDISSDGEFNRVKKKQQQKRQKKQQQKDAESGDDNADRLTLGHLLTMLDGGSETPGRFVIITTNQEDKLDAAFKRPGRLRSIHLDHLGFSEFKKMILYFHNPPALAQQAGGGGLTANGSLPTSELWTSPVEALAHVVMKDFKYMQSLRKDDLDKRGLGLSPAMLESLCIEAETLQDLFELLSREILVQWAKAHPRDAQDDQEVVPVPGIVQFREWDWKLHSLRIAVLWYVRDQTESRRQVVEEWPETRLEDFTLDRAFDIVEFLKSGISFFTDPLTEDTSFGRENVKSLVRALLDDEEQLNEALESCRFLPDTNASFQDLSYRSEVWMGGAFLRAPPSPEVGSKAGADVLPSLESALKIAQNQVIVKWELAIATGEVDIIEHLGTSTPPSCQAFSAFFNSTESKFGSVPMSAL